MYQAEFVRREVPVSDSVRLYITEYCESELDEILGRYGVTYQFTTSNGRWVLEMISDEQSISKAASDLSKFCLNIASHIGEDFFSLPGNFDLDVFTRLAGPRIAKPMQVLILPQAGACQLIGPSDQLAQAKEKLLALAMEHALTLSGGSDQSQMVDFTTPFGTQVSIVKGDLIHQQTEAIVNPANKNLQHHGGAAKAIAEAAGPRLYEECQAFIKDYGPLMTAEAMHTSSGNLYPRIKYVVHAVGPSLGLYPDVKDQRRLLEATFFNCLSYANEKLNISSISVPAIGSGIYGISKNLAAEAAFAGLQEFEGKNPIRNLLRINFVNIDDNSTDALIKVFRRQIGQNMSSKLRDGAPGNFQDPHRAGLQQKLAVGTTKLDHANKASHNSCENPADGTAPTTTDAQLGGDGLPLSMGSKANHNIVDSVPEPRRNQLQNNSHGHPGASATALEKLPTNSEIPQKCEAASRYQMTNSKTEECVICMEPMIKPKELPCGHKFCDDCIKDSFEKCQPKCPSCGRLFGVMRGNQPPGKMNVTTIFAYLTGYEQYDTLIIKYDIPDGIQNDTHPNPGQPYNGTRRTAYLPNTPEGKEVCELLQKAFEAGLIFTVGRSITSGQDNQVIWNDIHHKTEVTGAYGYPDPEYLSRVKEELKAKGIVPAPTRYRCALM